MLPTTKRYKGVPVDIQYLKRKDKPDLAYRKTDAKAPDGKPTVIFCGGFRSDMEGTKAVFLETLCTRHDMPFIRFDYSGHGSSGGAFEEGTIGQWKDDTLAIVDKIASGPVILVGSSMGGWISFLAAEERPDRVAGLVGLAAAPDFTREMYNENFTEEMRDELMRTGRTHMPNDYSDAPYVITKSLIDDGDSHCFLDRGMTLNCPYILIQGKKDRDVPWQVAARLSDAVSAPFKDVVYLDHADHRLSAPEELDVLAGVLRTILDRGCGIALSD